MAFLNENGLRTLVNEILAIIGKKKLTDLTTNEKTSLVGAVNEINTSVASKQSNLTVNPETTTSSLTSVGINGVNYKIDTEDKQDKTDNALNTTDKTITGAINELNDKVVSFSYSDSDTTLTITTIKEEEE